MFVILKVRGFIFFFLIEDALEPMCVHVESIERDKYAKFLLHPVILAKATGFKLGELSKVTSIVISYENLLKTEWEAFFKKKDKK